MNNEKEYIEQNLITLFQEELSRKLNSKSSSFGMRGDKYFIHLCSSFDLNNTGRLNFKDLWKLITKKLGMKVDSKTLCYIFRYITKDSEYLNYTLYASELYYSKRQIKEHSKEIVTLNFNACTLNLLTRELESSLLLIKLYYTFISFESKSLNRNIDNLKCEQEQGTVDVDCFISCIIHCKIKLDVQETQKVFHLYDKESAGSFNYVQLFWDLTKSFLSPERIYILKEVYAVLGGDHNSIGDIFTLASQTQNHYRHQLYQETSDQIIKHHSSFIKYFIRTFSIDMNQPANINFFITFCKFYFFECVGYDDSSLRNLVLATFDSNYKIDSSRHYADQTNINEKSNQPNLEKQNSSYENLFTFDNRMERGAKQGKQKAQMKPVLKDMSFHKLSERLKLLNRRSLLTFLKSCLESCQAWDSKEKYITLQSFTQILYEYKLLSPEVGSEVSLIFSKSKDGLNIDSFLKCLICKLDTPELELVNSLFFELHKLSVPLLKSLHNLKDQYFDDSQLQIISIEIMKSKFNAKCHPFEESESVILKEFCESLDFYHFNLNRNQNEFMAYEEFLFFFQVTNYLVKDAEFFFELVNLEWNRILNPNMNSSLVEVENSVSKPRVILEEKEDVIFDFIEKGRKDDFASTHEEEKEVEMSLKVESSHEAESKALIIEETSKDVYEIVIKQFARSLIERGVKGLMNLHKQFLVNCLIDKISHQDFKQVLKLQRIELSNLEKDSDLLFNYFSNSETEGYLNFNKFIGFFKTKLSIERLNYVRRAYAVLDTEFLGYVTLEDVKLKYDYKNHPKVKSKQINGQVVLMEFFDSFELNYNFLANSEENAKGITFGEFANFYEYVSFLHAFDEDFILEVCCTWGLKLDKSLENFFQSNYLNVNRAIDNH